MAQGVIIRITVDIWSSADMVVRVDAEASERLSCDLISGRGGDPGGGRGVLLFTRVL